MENKMTRRLFFRKLLTAPDFFFVLAKHLDEIFPDGWIYEDDDEMESFVESTHGWSKALKVTCEELELNDCWEWYSKFDWYDGDLLDGDIGSLLVAIVFDDNGNRIPKE